jgi:hypothetical protein
MEASHPLRYIHLYDTPLPRPSKNTVPPHSLSAGTLKRAVPSFVPYTSTFYLENNSVSKKDHSFSLFHFPPVIKNQTVIKRAVILLTKLRKQLCMYTDMEQWGEAYVAGKNYPTIYEKRGEQ